MRTCFLVMLNLLTVNRISKHKSRTHLLTTSTLKLFTPLLECDLFQCGKQVCLSHITTRRRTWVYSPTGGVWDKRTEIERLILKYSQKCKKPTIAKTILKKPTKQTKTQTEELLTSQFQNLPQTME